MILYQPVSRPHVPGVAHEPVPPVDSSNYILDIWSRQIIKSHTNLLSSEGISTFSMAIIRKMLSDALLYDPNLVRFIIQSVLIDSDDTNGYIYPGFRIEANQLVIFDAILFLTYLDKIIIPYLGTVKDRNSLDLLTLIITYNRESSTHLVFSKNSDVTVTAVKPYLDTDGSYTVGNFGFHIDTLHQLYRFKTPEIYVSDFTKILSYSPISLQIIWLAKLLRTNVVDYTRLPYREFQEKLLRTDYSYQMLTNMSLSKGYNARWIGTELQLFTHSNFSLTTRLKGFRDSADVNRSTASVLEMLVASWVPRDYLKLQLPDLPLADLQGFDQYKFKKNIVGVSDLVTRRYFLDDKHLNDGIVEKQQKWITDTINATTGNYSDFDEYIATCNNWILINSPYASSYPVDSQDMAESTLRLKALIMRADKLGLSLRPVPIVGISHLLTGDNAKQLRSSRVEEIDIRVLPTYLGELIAKHIVFLATGLNSLNTTAMRHSRRYSEIKHLKELPSSTDLKNSQFPYYYSLNIVFQD